MVQWLWQLQSDTLGSSPAVAGFSLFSFHLKQVGFQLNFHNNIVTHLRIYMIIYDRRLDEVIAPINTH